MSEFPRMLYKAPGSEEIHGGYFDTRIVNGRDEHDAALADGWHLTTPEAVDADKERAGGSAGSTMPAGDDTPPTRDEMKARAIELGLAFPGNISTAKLGELIEQALKPKD